MGDVRLCPTNPQLALPLRLGLLTFDCNVNLVVELER